MSFYEWLQHRLNVHEHRIRVDGIIGGETRGALIAFQQARGLSPSGVADNPTVEALRKVPSTSAYSSEAVPVETMPPWMAELHRRKGLHEVRDNKKLSDWLRIGRFLGDPAKLPWCGDAVETAMVKTLPAEPVPNNPFWAQAWEGFGIDAGGPKVGAVGVIRWNANAGHVGFVADYDASRRRVSLLGGNQSDMINLTWYALDRFIAFRWPKSYPLRTYPPLRGAQATGTLGATR